MPVFEVQAPDGSKYHVEAADEDTAVAGLKQHLGQSNNAAQPGNPTWMQSMLDALQKVSISPGGPPAIPSVMEMAKGIPIAGRYVPQTEAMTDLEEKYPTKAGFQRFAGGALSTVPVAGGVGMLTGTRFAPQVLGQATLGATLSGGDKLAEKGRDVSTEDMLHSMALGAGFGAAGPVAGKFISPSSARDLEQLRVARTAVEGPLQRQAIASQAKIRPLNKEYQLALSEGDRLKADKLWAEIEAEKVTVSRALQQRDDAHASMSQAPIPTWLAGTIDAGLGATAGHIMAGPGGALAGGILTGGMGVPSGAKILQQVAKTNWGQKYLHNQTAYDPMNMAVLNASGPGSTPQFNRPDNGQ